MIAAALLDCLVVGNATAATQAIVQEDFESSWPGWDVGDDTPASGYDYWGTTTYRSHQGSHSAWCAQVGNNSYFGQPNADVHCYDVDMGAYMYIPLSGLSGYDSVTLSFCYWAVTGSDTWGDNLEVWAFGGIVAGLMWTQEDYSPNSSGWQSVSVSVPPSSTTISFYFVSDPTVGLGPYEGAYVDDIVVTATDSTPPESSVSSLAAYKTTSSFSVAYAAADDGSGVTDVELYYRLGTSGSFLQYTTTSNPSGHWTTSPITFDTTAAGGDGTYQFYTRATDTFGNMESAPGTYDATTIVDTVAPSTIKSIAGTAGSNGWYLSSVTVTLVSSDSTSGIGATRYRIDSGSWQDYTTSFGYATEGSHTIEYYSADNAGNSESHWTDSMKIDSGQPSMTIDQPNGTSFKKSTATVSWACADNVSGLKLLEYSLDDAAYKSCTGDSLSLTELKDGTHTITLKATDNAGNTVERTLSFDVNTNVFSTSGPMGPWLDIGLLIVASGIILVVVLALKRRRGKKEPMARGRAD